MVEAELEKVSAPKKKSKASAQAEAARKRVLDKYFGAEGPAKPNEGFADPALLFMS